MSFLLTASWSSLDRPPCLIHSHKLRCTFWICMHVCILVVVSYFFLIKSWMSVLLASTQSWCLQIVRLSTSKEVPKMTFWWILSNLCYIESLFRQFLPLITRFQRQTIDAFRNQRINETIFMSKFKRTLQHKSA